MKKQSKTYHAMALVQRMIGGVVGLMLLWPFVILRGIVIGIQAAWDTVAEAEL